MADSQTALKNFTPVFDEVVQKYGIITAGVLGRVWRFAQQDEGVCRASNERIGGEIGVSARTAMRHLELLVKDGYLLDLTPDLRNRPHTYRLTDLTTQMAAGALQSAMTESHSTMTESHSKNDPAMTESHSTVTESHSRYDRESHEERGKKQVKKQKDTTPAEVLKPMISALSEVTGMDQAMNYSRLAKEAKTLIQAGYTPEQVRQVYAPGGAWWRLDWRGRDKRERPAVNQVRETIKKLLGAPTNGGYPPAGEQVDPSVLADMEFLRLNPRGHGADAARERLKAKGVQV